MLISEFYLKKFGMELRYKGDNKARKTINKHGLSIILLSSLLVGASLTQEPSLDFFKKNYRAMGDLVKKCVYIKQALQLSKEIEYDKKNLREALKREDNIARLAYTFKLDLDRDFAATAGPLFLDKENKLDFYILDDEVSMALSQIDNFKNDPEGFVKFYQDNNEIFDSIDERGAIKSAVRRLKYEGIGRERKMGILSPLIRMCKLIGNTRYSFSNLEKYLSENIIPGKYIGNYCLHTEWMNPISESDLDASEGEILFVFVLKSYESDTSYESDKYGFDTYALKDRKIEDFFKTEVKNWDVTFQTLQRTFKKKDYRGGNLF